MVLTAKATSNIFRRTRRINNLMTFLCIFPRISSARDNLLTRRAITEIQENIYDGRRKMPGKIKQKTKGMPPERRSGVGIKINLK